MITPKLRCRNCVHKECFTPYSSTFGIIRHMSKFIKHWISCAIVTGLLFYFIKGMEIYGEPKYVGFLLFVTLLAAMNTIVKPLLKILMIPLNFLTLGLASFILNCLLIYAASWIVQFFPYGIIMPNNLVGTISSLSVTIIGVLITLIGTLM